MRGRPGRRLRNFQKNFAVLWEACLGSGIAAQDKRISIRLALYEPRSLRCHSEERSDEESAVAFRVYFSRRAWVGQADFTRRRGKGRKTTADAHSVRDDIAQ